jgi:hypothetical protein
MLSAGQVQVQFGLPGLSSALAEQLYLLPPYASFFALTATFILQGSWKAETSALQCKDLRAWNCHSTLQTPATFSF